MVVLSADNLALAGAAIITPSANTEGMNLHLAEITTQIAEGALAVMLCDGAGWHRSADLVVPNNIVLKPIPLYTPQLNPMENVPGISASEQALREGVEGLRCRRVRLQRRLELAHRPARPHTLHRRTPMGDGV